MSIRPTDWSALGLGADPTPGDAAQVQDILTLLNTLAGDFQTIWQTLNQINGYATTDNFVGKAADALRGQMNGRLTGFVSSAHTAFNDASAAVTTYLAALNAQQQASADLLTKAQNSGLKSDDPQVKSWAAQAKQATTDLQSAEDTAAHAVRSIPGPVNPLSPWQEFLKILGWLALLLILPAMIFGGPIALIELVVNAILFVDALVNFAEGNISFGALLMSALGLIMPTTRGLDLGAIADLVKGLGSGVKTGIVIVRSGLSDFIETLTSVDIKGLLSVDTLLNLGNFALKAGVWVFEGLKNLPSTVIKAGVAFAAKLSDLIDAGAVRLVTSFKTGGWLSLILPVDATEVEAFGLSTAFRLGFLERGLLIPVPASRNLALINKVSFAGIHTGVITPEAFSHLDPPHFEVPRTTLPNLASLHTPTLRTDLGEMNIDVHLEAPNLSIGNLAAAIVHTDLGTGKISSFVPASIRIGHLELPDLRNPPELNRIGQGTVITHLDDVSFVTVHEDFAPQTMNVGTPHLNAETFSMPSLHTANVSVPSLHGTANVTVPSLHTTDMSVPSIHTASVHTTDISVPSLHNTASVSVPSFHSADVSIPSLRTANISVPTLHTADISVPAAANVSSVHDLPNLSAVAQTHINAALAHPAETAAVSTDHSFTLATAPHLSTASIGATPHVEFASTPTIGVVSAQAVHVATPDAGALGNMSAQAVHVTAPDVGALRHLATPPALTTHPVAAVEAPALPVVHLADAPHMQGVPPEIKTLQNTPEIAVHVSNSGLHSKGSEFTTTDDGGLNATAVAHSEASIPAVSSSGLADSAAHSAGSRGVAPESLSPDLAGAPGLLATGGERVAVPWADFKQAQHTYGDALSAHHAVLPEPNRLGAGHEGSVTAGSGKLAQTPAQATADADLHAAAAQLGSAAMALHALGTDALRETQLDHLALTDSLLARPRVPGGSRPGDEVLAVDARTGLPTLSTRGLGPNLRLYIGHGEQGGAVDQTATLVDVRTGELVDSGRLTEVGHGGIHVADPDGAGFREYGLDGTPLAQGLGVTDVLGHSLGVLTMDRAGLLADLHLTDGAALTHLGLRPLDDGGFHLENPQDGSSWQFDASGAMTHHSVRFEHGDGADPTDLVFDYRGGVAQLETPGLGSRTWDIEPGANGFTLTRAGGHELRFDLDNHLLGQTVPLHGGTELHADFTAPDGGGFSVHGGDGTIAHFTVTRTDLAHVTVTDTRDGTWRRFDLDGDLTAHTFSAHDHESNPLATIEVHYDTAQARFGGAQWDFTHGDNGFTLTRVGGHELQFGGDGRLVTRAFPLGDGTHLRADFPVPNGHQIEVRGDSGPIGHFNVARTDALHFTVTDTRDGTWRRFDTDGDLTAHTFPVHDHYGVPLNTMEVDYETAHASFGNAQWDYAHGENGFTLTRAGGHELHFDNGRQLATQRFPLPDGTRLHADFTAPPGRQFSVHDGTGPIAHFAVTRLNVGRFTVADTRDGTWRRFNTDGVLTAHTFHAADHDANPLDTVEVDYETGHAQFTTPGGNREQWDYTGTGGGFSLTRPGGHELHFDNGRRLTGQDFPLRDGTFLHADFRAPAGHAFSIHDNAGPVAHFTVTRTADDHFLATDTRTGQQGGAFATYTRFTGTVRDERVNLLDHNGMYALVDHTQAVPTTALHGGTRGFGHFTLTRDPQSGHFTLVDTRGVHAGDTRTFDPHGVPRTEHITITNTKGRATGEHFEVDFAGGRWTRQNAAGPVPTAGANLAPGEARLGTAYNAAGSLTLKHDGTLVLNGEDKTPAYLREPLDGGQTLEAVRGPNGSRYWTTWDALGQTGHGVRHYSTESDGLTAWDVGAWGRTIRQYRVSVDGGLVRAEKQDDGSFRWTRFTKDGDLVFSGTRSRTLTGWKDTYTVGGTTREAQRNWNAFNFVSRAGHYREYGVGRNAGTGTFELKASYKEISQQGKDTGSKELLADGHALTFTRYAEQRPPDFLWKTPENLRNPVSRALASSFLGSKYGAIDFTHEGVVFGDSRFQVFKWVEHDAVNGGATVSHGVRVLTPDGSFSDFAGDGVFVRGAVKLDNGHTVEVGRANDGKWSSFAPGPGGLRPVDTLDWRELDGAKNTVAQGTRNFQGKHWTDTFTGNDGAIRVARYTTGDGDVVHFAGPDRPLLPAGRGPGAPIAVNGQVESVTRNTMGQIVARDERWGAVDGAGTHVRVTGSGDPRAGNWTWRDGNGLTGTRLSGRNTRWTGSWDDSYADFRIDPAGGNTVLAHDFRALDKGTSLRAEPDAAGAWHSVKVDAQGRPIPGTAAGRSWKQPDGTYGAARPPAGMKSVPWRDTDAGGQVLRELVDGRVREFVGHDAQVWKEYDFGSVWRERAPVNGQQGLYLEKESFQKQWRVTNAAGTLQRFRSAAGRVWELDSFGRWSMVGTEREDKGVLTAIRGNNRRWREPNRLQFTRADGAAGAFVGDTSKLGQKTLLDVTQEFTIDVVANIVITGAVDDWNFSGDDWGRILLGGAIRAGVKGVYGVLTDTVLKGFRDGLRNLDGGKDFNRNPYNNDKNWDNEWAGKENPPRWRAGVFDYAVGGVVVPALANLLSTVVTTPVFGVGKEDIKLSGNADALAGGLGMAGNIVGGLTFGALRTFGHLGLSGRWFHQGGIPDIVLTFGEKLFINYMVNDVLDPAAQLKSSDAAEGQQQS